MHKLSFASTIVLLSGAAVPVFAADPPARCNGLAPTITASAPGVVQGTDGADVIAVNGAPLGTTSAEVGPVIVAAMGGDDTVCLSSNAANVVVGGDGRDTVSYERSEQFVVASMNTAGVRFRAHLDEVSQDTLVATLLQLAPGIDLLPQTEVLIGSPGADVLVGNVLEADTITGGPGDDTIIGLFGNDTLMGAAGHDLIIGDGYDEFVYGPVDGITVGPVTTPVLAPDADVLDGGDGNDSLNDDTGANTFRGGPGNDGFAQGFGDDTLDGGDGNDWASYAQRAAFVDLNKTTAQNTNQGNDKLSGIENITGSSENDTIIGTSASNILLAGAGDDRLAGSPAASPNLDQVDGGAGMDVCYTYGAGSSKLNCECPNAGNAACSVAPYDWEPSDGVGSPPTP